MTDDDAPLPELTPHELDLLMDADPMGLSARDKDQIVHYMRLARLRSEAGIKPKKGPEGAGQKLDLKALGLVKPAPVIRRLPT
jgi:hypothetical protein